MRSTLHPDPTLPTSRGSGLQYPTPPVENKRARSVLRKGERCKSLIGCKCLRLQRGEKYSSTYTGRAWGAGVKKRALPSMEDNYSGKRYSLGATVCTGTVHVAKRKGRGHSANRRNKLDIPCFGGVTSSGRIEQKEVYKPRSRREYCMPTEGPNRRPEEGVDNTVRTAASDFPVVACVGFAFRFRLLTWFVGAKRSRNSYNIMTSQNDFSKYCTGVQNHVSLASHREWINLLPVYPTTIHVPPFLNRRSNTKPRPSSLAATFFSEHDTNVELQPLRVVRPSPFLSVVLVSS